MDISHCLGGYIMKGDGTWRLLKYIMLGTVAFFGVFAILMLISGSAGGFMVVAGMALGFAGLAWAARRLLFSPAEAAVSSTSVVILVIFGGVGAMMVLGSIALLLSGEVGGAAALCVFGLIFGGAGYGASKIFAVPEGKKPILIHQHQAQSESVYGQTTRTISEVEFVDTNLTEEELARRQQQHAAQPWTQRAEWVRGRMERGHAGSLGMFIGFTVVWNIIGWGIVGFAFLGGDGDAPLFLWLFPLVGVALAVMVGRMWIRQRKFGISILTLDTVPAPLGGSLSGTLETNVRVQDVPPQGFCVRLLCLDRISYRDSDGDRRVREEKIWGGEQYVPGRRQGATEVVTVPISFNIPSHLPPTEMSPSDDRVLWRLNVTASTPGVDYFEQFEVPVF